MKTLVLLLTLLSVALAPPGPIRAQNPDSETLNTAIAEYRAGNTANALALLTEIISKHPKRADAYLVRGDVKLALRDTSGALDDINRAIQLKLDMGQAYNERAYIRAIARDIDGAIQDLTTAIKFHYRADHVYEFRGRLKVEKTDFTGALTDFNEALKRNPNNPQTYASRAGLLLTLEDRARALIDLDYLLTWYEIDPMNKRASLPAGEEDVQSPKPVSSRVPIVMGLRTTNAPGDREMLPVIANAYTNRGLIHSFQGKASAAISDYTKSIRLDPKNMWAYYNRAKELAGKGDLEAALADVNRSIQLDPRNGNFRVEHGVVLTLMGNTKDAQIDFDMLLNSDRELWQKRIDERMAAVKKKKNIGHR